jgi:CHAT domain-containing protein
MLFQSRLLRVSLLSILALYWGQPIAGTMSVARVAEVMAQASTKEAAEKAFTQADQLYQQGTLEALKGAIAKWEEALNLYREIGDRSGETRTLNHIGKVYSDWGEKQKALDYYNQSLSLSREIGDRQQEALTLHNMGNDYSVLGEKPKALDYYNHSLALSQEIGNRQQEAYNFLSIGMIYAELGEKPKALDYYHYSLSLSQEIGDRRWQALTMIALGNLYSGLGEQQKALDYYSQSLPLSRAIKDRIPEAFALICAGRVYSELGEKQTALNYYNQSLKLFRAMGNREQEARNLNYIGIVYSDLGEQQKALEYFSQSLPISQAVGDRSGQAVILISIGHVYSELGEQPKALEYYSQSLRIFQAIGDRSSSATTLTSIGIVYLELEDKEKALEYFSQSLILKRIVGDRSGEALTLTSMGKVYAELEKPQKALEYFNQSLPLRRIVGDRSGEALTLTNIGKVYANLGEKEKALEYFNQSLPLSQSTRDRSSEALILYSIATVKRDFGNLNEALTNIKAAIEIIEDLRTKIVSPELRTSYFATVQKYYQFYIDLLMQLHKNTPNSSYDRQALEASEHSRARSLIELLKEANANIREGVSPELLQKERSLQQELDHLEQQFTAIINRANPIPEKQTELDRKRQILLAQYEDIQAQIRATSPRYAALTQPQPLTLAEIQQQILDENTNLLQYSLGKERSYLWVVTKTSLTSYELPKADDIEEAARNFRDNFTNHRYRNNLNRLAKTNNIISQMILSPVAAQLGKKRLLIVGDGVLNYLPFTALSLPDNSGKNGNNFLIFDHEIVLLPSASTLAILRQNYNDRQSPNKDLAILADPVFSANDERVKSIYSATTQQTIESANLGLNRSSLDHQLQFKRLKFTRQEAEVIQSLFPINSRSEFLDFDANRTTATNPNLSQYKIIHFATHGLVDSVHPELSGIVMSLVDKNANPLNGFLRLTDIFNLKLSADLVVLSACQTGLGQNIQGEGMVGLTRGFMYAGAKRVVVSLWSVDDQGTAQLMVRFYQGMLQKGLPPAAALRAAQLEMLQQEKWHHPYYWAAFTLQGEW